MSSSCAQWRGEIGAYVVGALDNPARDRVTRHLAACAGCRADYSELVPVRDKLRLLDLSPAAPEPGHEGPLAHRLHNSRPGGHADAAGEAPVAHPSRTSGSQSQTQPAARSRWSQTRTRRLVPAVVVALVALAAVVAVLVSEVAPTRTFRAADSTTGVSGRAVLHDTSAGTQIDLTASGLPRDERCILVAVTRRGTDIAGSWSATYGGLARIAGMTAFPAGQLIALRVESDTGILLLSIRV